MDRVIVYPGSVPLDTHILQPQRNAEIALGFLMRAAFGTTTVIDGLAVTQQASPNMTVQVGQGSVVTQTVIDPTGVAFGSLPLDSSTNLVKIGVNAAPVNMSALTAPGTAGQSQNWLIEASFLEADGSPTVLPYYNAANPSLPYTGPANAGTSQNTRRTNTVQLQWKAGTAATTGQQNTPTPDSGWVGVAIVTVANGQSSITNANITAYSAAPFVPTKLPQQRTKLTANTTIYVSTFGNDTNNSGLSASSPFLTLQKAWNYAVSSLDLNGFNVTVQLASGTYTGGLIATGNLTGIGTGNSITFLGNTGSPSSVVISTANAHCIYATGTTVAVSGMQFQTTGSTGGNAASALFATATATINVVGVCTFAACAGSHMWASQSSLISVTTNYNVTGGAVMHYNLNGSAQILVGGFTVTVTGTPAFSFAFASSTTNSILNSIGQTLSGVATGTRYIVNLNGVILTNTASASFYPGSSAGSSATGGQYT